MALTRSGWLHSLGNFIMTATHQTLAAITLDAVPSIELFRQIDTKEAAAFLNVRRRTLELYRQHGGGPQFVKFGRRCVRYRMIDLLRFQEKQLRNNTSEGMNND